MRFCSIPVRKMGPLPELDSTPIQLGLLKRVLPEIQITDAGKIIQTVGASRGIANPEINSGFGPGTF